MNYQTMQHQAREKHQQLRQEARHHRLARQAKTGPTGPSRSNVTGKLAAAFVGLAAVAAAVIALN
jgi:hypothetical protein